MQIRCTNPDCQFQFLPEPALVTRGYSPQVVTVRCPRCNVWGAHDADIVNAALVEHETEHIIVVPAEFVAWYNREGSELFAAWKRQKQGAVEFTEVDRVRLHGMGASL